MTMAFALPQVEIMWNGQTPNAIEFQDFEPLDGGEDLVRNLRGNFWSSCNAVVGLLMVLHGRQAAAAPLAR
eukprot:m.89636 g.89636  ORF g.89636 m.89636 type:complete len:71 (+) comp51053_c0_seq1:634-846(+)